MTLIHNLMHFLDSCPTAWHAVDYIAKELKSRHFEELDEGQPWKIRRGGAYFVRRNGSTLGAFVIPKKAPHAFTLLGAHTDSPTFKIKPNAEFLKENVLMLGVEVYGGPLLTSWLNRDLGIAGRVVYKDTKNKICEALVRLDSAPLLIPQLAIHLDRNVNENGLILNKQDHLAVLAALVDPKKKKTAYLESLIKEQVALHTLLGHDLFLYPLEKARLMGSQKEMLASYRIDNLGGVHAILSAMTAQPHEDKVKMAFFWDNEEIGSNTSQGAGSPFLPQILERIALNLGIGREDYFRLLKPSLCVSVDLTHALHPNYADKHEPRHQLLMKGGIVIKSNALYRFASDARTQGIIVGLCQDHNIPYQQFVTRSDIPSGTTIGPIAAHLTGIPTVDIGYPQLSMHSCRELGSCRDHESMCQLLKAVYLI
jgi:aspartyl aminopeptidase